MGRARLPLLLNLLRRRFLRTEASAMVIERVTPTAPSDMSVGTNQ